MARSSARRRVATRRSHGAWRVACVAGVAVACTFPGRAQEGEPASRVFVDLAAGLLASDNYEEIEDPTGTTTVAFSDLVAGYESRSAIENFSFSTGFRLETGDYPDAPDFDGGLTNPFASLRYGRRGRDGSLTFSARYAETDLGVEEDILDGDDLVLDRGTRQSSSVDVGLTLGESAPIGFRGALRFRDRTFVDTDPDADLDDSTFFGTEAGLSFRLTPTTSLTLDAEYFEQDDDDEVDRFEENRFVGLGLSHSTPGGLDASVTAGYQVSDVTVTDPADGDRVTQTFEEPVLRFNLSQDRPNGELRAGLAQRVTDTGLQADLRLGRSLELPVGALDASLGVAYSEQSDSFSGVGSLNWTRPLPRGQFAVTFEQSLVTDDDEDVLRSRAGLSLSQDLTRLSTLSLELDLAAQEAVDDDGTDQQRVLASLVYSYRLTEDWNLNAGYRYRSSRETGEDPTIRNEVFANIARRFTLRP